MEVETTKKSYNWDWIKINLKFMTEVIQQAGNLPLDSACTAQELFLTAVDRTGNPSAFLYFILWKVYKHNYVIQTTSGHILECFPYSFMCDLQIVVVCIYIFHAYMIFSVFLLMYEYLFL